MRLLLSMLVLLGLVLSGGYSLAFELQQKQVYLVAKGQVPYVVIGPDGQITGTSVKPIQYSLDKMGVPYEIEIVPWLRAQAMVKDGLADGFFPGSQNQERNSYARQSAPLLEFEWVWYTRADSQIDPRKVAFKNNAVVTSYVGSNMCQWLKANNYNVASEPSDTSKLFKMLLSKRVDAILANNHVANLLIKRDHLEGKFDHFLCKRLYFGVYFSFAFLKRNPAFLEAFNIALLDYQGNHNPNPIYSRP